MRPLRLSSHLRERDLLAFDSPVHVPHRFAHGRPEWPRRMLVGASINQENTQNRNFPTAHGRQQLSLPTVPRCSLPLADVNSEDLGQ